MQVIETTFYSHSTSYYGTMCAIRSKPYDCDLRKETKISSKNTKKNIFGLFIFPQKLCRRLKRLSRVILHHITAPCVQLDRNCMAGIQEREPKLVQKTQKKTFLDFYISSKTVQAFETTFLQSFHIILRHHVCN